MSGKKLIRNSARRALEEYLAVKKGETILLLYDCSTRTIAEGFRSVAEENGISFSMHEIKPTGGNGREPDPNTAARMKKYDVVIAPTKYSLTHTKAAIEARKAGARVATLPGINTDIFIKGLASSPSQLEQSGSRWLRILKGRHLVKVTSKAGTSLQFEIGDYPLKDDNGKITRSGQYGNLPAGETYLAPDIGTATGTIVVDGSIGSLPWNKNTPPAKLILEDGLIKSFEGKRAQSLKKLLAPYGKKGLILAEFGIGTNSDLKLTGNLLGDEKVKGTVHFAFGNNSAMGGDNYVQVHIDCLVIAPDVFLDDRQVMKHGRWLT
ncbi:MAG TPA: leucyl aminopeptidase [Lentisphaeria bacterium]|nr:MAG: hypothetical protein A2X48_17320 [Lentisphaerae bacterium GWF2_49_21]HBC88315.1 leucyl aminopeptidase [Lentisphaeria bacterium]